MAHSQTPTLPPPAPAPVAINRLKALLAQANSGVARTADAVVHFLQPSAATNRAKLKQKRRSKDSGKSIDSAIKSSNSVATAILASAPLSLGSLETVGITESTPIDSLTSLETLESGAPVSEEKLAAWRLSTGKVQRLLVAALADAGAPDGLCKRATKLRLKSYMAEDFCQIRSRFGVHLADIVASFATGPLKVTGAGKSGSVMLWSADRRFIAKSLTAIERSNIAAFLPAYRQHVVDNEATFLVPYLALVRVGKERLLVMPNALHDFAEPNELYDLKGSSHGRSSSSAPLKDLNMVQDGVRWNFDSAGSRKAALVALERDASFLAGQGIIDYSLLLALGPRGQSVATIIDCATKFTAKKRLEHAFIGALHGRKAISCVPPKHYAERFVGFLASRAIAI